MSLGRDQFALFEVVNAVAGLFDDADEFVPDHHGDGDRLLGPGVPVINVNVGAADRTFLDADENVVRSDLGNGNFFQIEARFALTFDQSRHHFAHGTETR